MNMIIDFLSHIGPFFVFIFYPLLFFMIAAELFFKHRNAQDHLFRRMCEHNHLLDRSPSTASGTSVGLSVALGGLVMSFLKRSSAR